MSSDMLYIWDPLSYGPAPTTFEEAAAKVRELSNGVKGRPCQAILAFAQRMQDVVKLNQMLMKLLFNAMAIWSLMPSKMMRRCFG